MKAFVAISICVVLEVNVSLATDYVDQVNKDRPVAQWRFEDLSGKDNDPVKDGAGGHDGVYLGGVALVDGVPSIGGRAARFNGKSAHVNVPHDKAFDLNELTVEFWFRSDEPFATAFWPGSAAFVTKATLGKGTADWTINALTDGRILSCSGPEGTKNDFLVQSPAGRRLDDGAWHHVVSTRDAKGKKQLFVDGELVATGSDGGGKITNSRPIQIGGERFHSGGAWFKGDMDEVAIYDHVLSADRVGTHFVTGMFSGRLPPPVARKVDFVRDIQPIFAARCYDCHGPGEEDGGLKLSIKSRAIDGGDSGPALIPGSSLSSRLVHYVSRLDADKTMPPDGEPLTKEQIGLIRAWIDQGAKWPDGIDIVDPQFEKARKHWAYQPIRRPELPPVKRRDWVRNEIDRFVLAKLEAAGLEPSAEADPVTLLRRASFDLIGLPPSPKDVAAVLADSEGHEAVVRKLLDSNHYGERWARHWLDVVRYADSAGYETDLFYEQGWRYRDYVIRSLNADKSFKVFIHEQVAGDEIWPDRKDEMEVATSLYTLGQWRNALDQFKNQPERLDELAYLRRTDRVNVTGAAFLALTFDCSRCHNHKYDPITQRDYFSLQALFAATASYDKNTGTQFWYEAMGGPGEYTQQRYLRPAKTVPDIRLLRRGELNNPGPITSPGFPAFLPGGGKIDDSRSDEHLHRRETLARWITSPDNPLTARVIVNRIWQWHFGKGLVRTPNDFGAQGDRPSHSALLDWLAVEFVEHGWSLKHLHRLIMDSATYRMSSQTGERAMEQDPDNRLLSHFPRQRMQAEIIWDHLHATAGTLNRKLFGPVVFPPLTSEEKAGVRTYRRANTWKTTKDKSEWTRRGIYIASRRAIRFPLFDSFDPPNNSTSCPTRSSTTVPTQSLTLLNSKVAVEQACAFAGRLLRECGNDTDAIVRRAWLLAFGRPAGDDELRLARDFLKQRQDGHASKKPELLPSGAPESLEIAPSRSAAIVDLCLALFNTNQFVYID